jgi:hypothetical protein
MRVAGPAGGYPAPCAVPKSVALTVTWSWTANAVINGNLAMHKPKSGFYLVDITEPGCADQIYFGQP